MKTRQKVTFGDFSINSPTLSTSGNFGGVLWQSNFRQYGQFDFMPSFDMNFNVATPSHAELYVNQVKTNEWDLQPGTVNMPSLLSSGQGDATLVLTDTFGRQQQITQPFYVTQQLLKPGLHDFYYGLGAKRRFSNNSLNYGETVLLGSHRYGFNNNLTAGGAFTATKKVSNLGASLTYSFAGNSLIDTTITMSHQSSLNGYLAVARYQFNYDNLNFALNSGYQSHDYGNLYTDAASLQKNKARLQASFNYNIPFTGSSLGVSASQTSSWNNTKPSHAVSLFYRQSLLRNLSLNTSVNHDLGTGDNVASLMLNYFPDAPNDSILHNNNLSYQASYNDQTHQDTQRWQVQKQGNIGEGYNYTTALQKQNQNLSGFARYQYKDNNAVYTANYAQNEQTIGGNVGIAGSLLAVNNEVYLGRPITDSFAVVKVKGTEEDIPIYQDGAFLGVGNENKALIIPTLQSRRVAQMNLKPEDMGLALVADQAKQAVEVGVRTASLVEFTLSKFVAVEGHAYILGKNGKKEFLEALPLEYTVKGKKQDSFIAKKGFFYLENVPTGEFKATVKRYQHDCTLHLTIPKSDKVVVKLGDVLCTAD
jgi:outer membrane usher protein